MYGSGVNEILLLRGLLAIDLHKAILKGLRNVANLTGNLGFRRIFASIAGSYGVMADIENQGTNLICLDNTTR